MVYCTDDPVARRLLEAGWGAFRGERFAVRNARDLGRLLDRVVAALDRHGYTRKEQFGVRLALEEAVVNGLKHGHRGDPRKAVRVRAHVEGAFLLVQVEDEGPGFRPEGVPDPADEAHRDRPTGRGLLLMRHYMDGVRYNDRGNRVLMCKVHAAPGG